MDTHAFTLCSDWTLKMFSLVCRWIVWYNTPTYVHTIKAIMGLQLFPQVLEASWACVRATAATGWLPEAPAVLQRDRGRAAVGEGAQVPGRLTRLWQEPYRRAKPPKETPGAYMVNVPRHAKTSLYIQCVPRRLWEQSIIRSIDTMHW